MQRPDNLMKRSRLIWINLDVRHACSRQAGVVEFQGVPNMLQHEWNFVLEVLANVESNVFILRFNSVVCVGSQSSRSV